MSHSTAAGLEMAGLLRVTFHHAMAASRSHLLHFPAG
jgi:hypothetical protein